MSRNMATPSALVWSRNGCLSWPRASACSLCILFIWSMADEWYILKPVNTCEFEFATFSTTLDMPVPCCNSSRRNTWWVRLGLTAEEAKRGLDRISALRCSYFAPGMVGVLVWRALATNPSIGVLALLALFGLFGLFWWAASWTNTGRKNRRQKSPTQCPVRGPPNPAIAFATLRYQFDFP